jgi:hypothetical protein
VFKHLAVFKHAIGVRARRGVHSTSRCAQSQRPRWHSNRSATAQT